MRFFAGVDGGGTATRCVIIDQEGNVSGYGKAGPANYHSAGRAVTAESLLTSMEMACATLPPGFKIEALFLALAGVVSNKDKDLVLDLSQFLLQKFQIKTGNVQVNHDCQAALAGATGCVPGIIVISGTGSSCYGENENGESWMAGGWGYILDDLGSSYYLGQQALVSAVQYHDGRGPFTILLKEVMQKLSLIRVEELMHWLYFPNLDRAAVAELAPLVIQAAESGDLVAQNIVNKGSGELAVMVKAVAKKLDTRADQIRVATAGGLLNNAAYYRGSFKVKVLEVFPKAELIRPFLPPVLGAALLAYRQANGTIEPDVLAKLKSQQKQLN